MKKEVHYLVFDGTSHYVIPESELNKNEEELIQKYYDFDYACEICDKLNEKCSQ